MENFFNYLSKNLDQDEVDIWFNANNIIPEKLELYYDFTISLYNLVTDTYLGENTDNETKVTLSDEDNTKHFDWCWKKTVDNFYKEGLEFNQDGDHHEYFKSFFDEIYYKQENKNIKDSIGKFFSDIFDREKPFTRSDMDMIYTIYRSLDKNLNV
jgi:hypothetical protein